MRWGLLLLVACSSRHEGDIPLHVTNPPTCPAGRTPAKQLVIRIENGSDHVQQTLGETMRAANTWAGRPATLKLALCPLNDPCPNPVWIRTGSITVHGDDSGLELELPFTYDLPCNDPTGPN